MKKIKAQLSLALAACLFFCFSFSAAAAGKGYTDMIRIHTLAGIDGKNNIRAYAFTFGDAANDPSDNSVVIMKANTDNGTVLLDVVSEARLQEIVKTCITSSQTDVRNMNELLLSYGAPDEWLLTDTKPYVVSELEKAISSGQATVRVKDSGVIMPEALKMAADSGVSKMQFDTTAGGAVQVRLTVDVSKTTKGFATLADCRNSTTDPVSVMMDKFYANRFARVDFLQEGSFGTTVQVAAKVNLAGLDTKSLRFSRYNPLTNKMKTLDNVEYKIDENGFLHFNVSEGGVVVITDRALAKK